MSNLRLITKYREAWAELRETGYLELDAGSPVAPLLKQTVAGNKNFRVAQVQNTVRVAKVR